MKKKTFLLSILLFFVTSCSSSIADRKINKIDKNKIDTSSSQIESSEDNDSKSKESDQESSNNQETEQNSESDKDESGNKRVSSLDDYLLLNSLTVNDKFKVPYHYEDLYYEAKVDNNINGGFSEEPNTYCYLKNINSIKISNITEENYKSVTIYKYVNPYIGWKGLYRYKYGVTFHEGYIQLSIINELVNPSQPTNSEENDSFNPLDNKNYTMYISTTSLDYRIELIQSDEERVEYNTTFIKNNV